MYLIFTILLRSLNIICIIKYKRKLNKFRMHIVNFEILIKEMSCVQHSAQSSWES